MKIFLCIMLLLSYACSSSRVYRKPYPKAGDANSKLVSRVWVPSPTNWVNSRWYRMNVDLETPARVIIAGEYACVLDTPEVNEPRSGQYYVCKTGWRYPHT